MCDHGIAGTVALLLVVVNAALRNLLRLWPVTQVIVGLGAVVALLGPVLRLGYFVAPGVYVCVSRRADDVVTWILGIAVMVFVGNCVLSFGKTRSGAPP